MSDKGSRSRTRRPFVLLAILCVAAVVGVLTGVTRPPSATQFANTGHWVYNSVVETVFHIDGATLNIDAQLEIDADPGSQVLQSDTHGYVVGPNRITEFDKAAQTTGEPVRPPTDEPALGIEVVGGPYAVYRNAGTIVRLGDPTATISAGGAIGNPVVTEDGTMWFHRTGNGRICRLDKTAVTVSGCPVSAPKDHPGAMTVVNGRPAFVDLFTSRLHTLDAGAFGAGVPLGVSLSPDSRPAAQDTGERVVILDQGRSSLVLVDIRTRPAKATTVALPSGDYDGPVANGEVVALINRQKGVLLTFGPDGARTETPIKDKTGQPRLTRGDDDRIYVEDADGTQVMVVSEDGSVQDVDVTGKSTTPTQTPPPAATEPPPPPTADQADARPASPPTKTHQPVEPPIQTPPPPVPPGRPDAPVSLAGPPVGLQAIYDKHDEPTRDVKVTWGQPDLRGGTLVHYELTATNRGTETLTSTEKFYSQVDHSETITFTVRAVTRTPDGQILRGEPATATHQDA